MIRDFQRSKVYAWEYKQFPKMKSGGMTLDECKALAAKLYGARVLVKDGRGRRNACAFTSKRLPAIALPKWARTPEVVAHEVAHWLAKGQGPAHGGFFLGHYIAILAEHLGHDKAALTESARAFGLRVIETEIKQNY
jgi:putative metallohydrolase (TIGR04338 family)